MTWLAINNPDAWPVDNWRVDLDDLITSVITLGLVAAVWLMRRGMRSLHGGRVRELEEHDKAHSLTENGLTARVRVLEALRLEDLHRIERLEDNDDT